MTDLQLVVFSPIIQFEAGGQLNATRIPFVAQSRVNSIRIFLTRESPIEFDATFFDATFFDTLVYGEGWRIK